MHQVHLSDKVFQTAKKAAEEQGFETVEAYVSGLIEGRVNEDLDHVFTPEVIDELDRRAESARAGNIISLEEFSKRLEAHQTSWTAKSD